MPGVRSWFDLSRSDRRKDFAVDAELYPQASGQRMAKKKGITTIDGFGLGLDYLIVDRKTLVPLPPASVGGSGKDVIWSINEARTGIRLSTAVPEKNVAAAADRLSAELPALNALLEDLMDGMLLPTGAHPLATTADLQNSGPVDDDGLNDLFADAGRQWTSSSRIELPFADEHEFGRLHTAIRMVLPLIPAISASSPFFSGKLSGGLSTRILRALDGTQPLSELTGAYIPEVALDQADYYRIVLEPIARALAERGLADAVDYQLANRRAAIPSFERSVITITVADTQECVSSDAAIAEMTITVINAMTDGRWVSNYLQRAWHETDLGSILKDVARQGGEAVIANRDYLLMFGMMRESATAAELWRHLYQQLRGELSEAARIRLAYILDHGCLAQRILRRTGDRPSRERILEVYRELATCLRENAIFN